MAVDILLGLQWGDEGKGKVVDFLAKSYKVVARFQGGPNAGHTLVINNQKHVLHQVPSGIFHPHIINVVGNGVVLDPAVFMGEIAKLIDKGVHIGDNLQISDKAQIITPTHKCLDAAWEADKGKDKIGSTLRGIGPTYQDKVARNGLRVGDIFEPNFNNKYNELKKQHIKVLDLLGYDYNQKLKESEELFFEAIDGLRKLNVSSTEYLINRELQKGSEVLAEGAQGAMLDIDFGSYPFVTSSNTTAAGVCSGLGVAPKAIGEVFGIMKAYCTRVGSGPFPTELLDSTGEELRRIGSEFGATTGRPRRCGWLDLPALNYAIMLNGVTQLLIMKIDVLSEFDQISVCTNYKMADGSLTQQLPYSFNNTTIEPVLEQLPGWKSDLSKISNYFDMPDQLKSYVEFIECNTQTPVTVVSLGPDRSQTVIRHEKLRL